MARRKIITDDGVPSPNAGIRWMWMLIGVILLAALVYIAYQMLVGDSQLPEGTTITEPPIALEGKAALDRITELNKDELLPIDEDWERPLLEGDYDDARRQLESLLSNSLEMSEFTRHAYFLGLLYLYMPEPQRNLDRAVQYLEIGKNYRSDAVLYILKAYVEAGRLEKARDILQKNPEIEKELPKELLNKITPQEENGQ
jgi:tetratricopeptide (TPR) repeat protein